MYCQKCGMKIAEADRFCGNCGAATLLKADGGVPCQKKHGRFGFWIIWTLVILFIEICVAVGVKSEIDKYERMIFDRQSMCRAFDRAERQDKYETTRREVKCPDGAVRVFLFNSVHDLYTGQDSQEWLAGDEQGRQVAYECEEWHLCAIQNNRGVMVVAWIMSVLLGVLVWQVPYWFCKWLKRR